MSSLRPLIFAVLASASLMVTGSPLYAQVPDAATTAAAPVPGVGHDYIGLQSETVNPADGSLSFHLTIPTPRGRELSFPFGISYRSSEPYYLSNLGSTLNWTTRVPTQWNADGWSYDLPVLTTAARVFYMKPIINQANGQIEGWDQCDASQDYTFRGLDAKQYTLGLGAVWNDPNSYDTNACDPNLLDHPTSTSSAHGIYARFSNNEINQPAVTVTDESGTAYQFPSPYGSIAINPQISSGQDWGLLAQTITDRNGNQIMLNSSGNGYTDTLGRQIVTWSTPPGTAGSITVAGYSNPYQLSYSTVSSGYSTGIQNVGSGGTCTGGNTLGDTYAQVSQITLPNGRAYTFDYSNNVYGMVDKITFPDGGYISYTWGLDANAASQQFSWVIQDSSGGCVVEYGTPAVTDRYVNDGTKTVLHQHFVYTPTVWGSGSPPKWTSKTTTVTTYDLVANTTSITVYTYSPMTPDQGGPYDTLSQQSQVPVEETIQYEDGSGHVLRTVNKAWANTYSMAAEQTILDNNQGSANLYCGDNGIITDVYEYGFQSEGSFPGAQPCVASTAGLQTSQIGPLLRHTVTVYHNSGIADEPDSVTVYDGSGNQVSQTTLTYDAGGVTASGAQTGLVSPPGAARGNVSTVTHWLSGGTSPITSYTYYDTGQVYQMTDPKLNVTTYSYTDSYSSCSGNPPPNGSTNAYLTQVTYPPTNGVGHIVKSCYSYDDGQLRSSTDQNGQLTYYKYNDSLNRLTETDYPDTGQTLLSYNDTPPNPSVTTQSLIGSGVYLTTTDTMDGLGQHIESLLTSDPDCASGDRTDTTYDGFGRVYTVSNPYCTTSDPTYGITTYTYDALGRTCLVEPPGGTSGGGSCPTVTAPVADDTNEIHTGRATEAVDASGKARISQVDGLGRLTSICEVTSTTLSVGITGSTTPAPCGLDIGATGFLTTYGYDTLGNLTSVSQGPLNPRSFTYDSLGQLLTANNPESGQTMYGYDADGNLITKTDARGTTICFGDWNGTSCNGATGYDALNRLLKKTYSDSAPAVTYNYDQSSEYNVTLTNTVGRLSSESTAGTYPTYSVFSYDPMGRITNNSQSLWGGYRQALPYTYDLLGHRVTSDVGAPNGTLAVTETYNAAGRLTKTTTNPAYYNSGISTLITSAHYNALGEITQQALGNGLTENWTYDDRGREASYSLTNGSTSLYSYSLSYFPNGNVMSSNDTINGDWVFGYDDLNRMTSATVTGQEHSPNATFAYLYDRFGNRWDQSVTSGSGPTSSLAFDANNHITASGVTYDAAGDVTYDGANTYTYDAEGRISADTNLNTQTFYDAQGRRDIIKAPSLQYPDYYVYDLQDHPLGIWNPAYAYFRGEYYAGGRHVANFSNLLMFMHPDWLGTEHYRTESNGTSYGSCQNDPFGDNMWCSEAQGDLSPVHFTGKERDYSGTANPDGLDYFGARYYSSNMARFMSPDWAAKPTAVPYAMLGDPQSLNLYTYVVDDPISMIDPDGHQDCAGGGRSDPENHGLGTCDNVQKATKKNEGQELDKIEHEFDASLSDPPGVYNGLSAGNSLITNAQDLVWTSTGTSGGLSQRTKQPGYQLGGQTTLAEKQYVDRIYTVYASAKSGLPSLLWRYAKPNGSGYSANWESILNLQTPTLALPKPLKPTCSVATVMQQFVKSRSLLPPAWVVSCATP